MRRVSLWRDRSGFRALRDQAQTSCRGDGADGSGGDRQRSIQEEIERTAPTEADFKALKSALVAKGLDKVEIDALLDGKMPDPPLADARMCAAGQTYLETLRALPEAARLRIYGLAMELMARS